VLRRAYYSVNYTDDAPYMQIEADLGRLNLDGSLRLDTMHASGVAYANVAGANVTVSDALGSPACPPTTPLPPRRNG
jgi:outer membrane cobalamin receptor